MDEQKITRISVEASNVWLNAAKQKKAKKGLLEKRRTAVFVVQETDHSKEIITNLQVSAPNVCVGQLQILSCVYTENYGRVELLLKTLSCSRGDFDDQHSVQSSTVVSTLHNPPHQIE